MRVEPPFLAPLETSSRSVRELPPYPGMKAVTKVLAVVSIVLLQGGTAPAAPNGPKPFALDLVGNGIDLGGQTTTALFGTVSNVRWTKAGSDDAFLVVDATKARQKGIEMKSGAGVRLNGDQLVRGGARLRFADGREVAIIDSWQFLEQLDANKDGKLSASDPVWSELKLFGDANSDGKMESGELMALGSSGVVSISLTHASETADAFGNLLANGTYQTGSGSTRTASGVTLAPPKPFPRS